MVKKFIIVACAILIIVANFILVLKEPPQVPNHTFTFAPFIRELDIEATAYTEAEDECGRPKGHPDYGRTASGEFVKRGMIAVDTDVIPMHSKVLITGAGHLDGIYLAKDTGGAIVGNRVDIYVTTKKEAFNFGRRKVKLYVIREGK